MNIKMSYFLLMFLIITGCASHTKEHTKIATATRALGEAYMAQGNYIAALRELLDAEKIIPQDPFLQYDLGLVYMAREKYDLAENHLKKAIVLKNNYTAAQNSLGVVFMKQKEWDTAIALFRKTSTNLLYATPHYPLSNMGWAFLGKGDLKGAEAIFKEALKAKPNFINAIHGLASTYLARGDSRRSKKLIDKAILKYPKAPILHADLAKILEKKGNFQSAMRSWQQVVNLAPGNKLADEAARQLKQLSRR